MIRSITVFAIVLLSCSQFLESVPLPEPQHSIDNFNGNYAKDQEDFMIRNGVTQEEIKEFHRLHGYSISNDNEQQSQGRTFSKLIGNLKFWNWSSFDKFRQWIDERRRFDIVYRTTTTTTTTIRPIPVYIVKNPNGASFSYPYQKVN